MSTSSSSTSSSSTSQFRSLLSTAAAAGIAASVVTTALAAAARAADVSLDVDGQAIPLSAFPWWTLVATMVGVVLARLVGDPRRFVTITLVATGLSLVPAIALPDDTATRLTLVAAHLSAAAIVIPALTRKVGRGDTGQLRRTR